MFSFSDVVANYVLPTLTTSTKTIFSTAVNSSSRRKSSKFKKKGQFFIFGACTFLRLQCFAVLPWKWASNSPCRIAPGMPAEPLTFLFWLSPRLTHHYSLWCTCAFGTFISLHCFTQLEQKSQSLLAFSNIMLIFESELCFFLILC